MIPIVSLWLPIVLSAVAVFLASSVIHMALGYHKHDFQSVPDEGAARAAIGGLGLAPGTYCLPRATSMADMKDPVFAQKMAEGPNVLMTVLARGGGNMGKMLGQWFFFSVVVAIFAAYIASRTLAAGAPYLSVFRVVASVVFASYAFAVWPPVIWYSKSSSTAWRETFDALVYGLLSAGVFGWLWPAPLMIP